MKHAKFRHESDTGASLRELAGLAIAVLVMLGVGGTAFHLVAPGGWLALLFDRSLAGGIAALLSFVLIGVSAWLISGWISVTGINRYADVLVYVFAAAGFLYAVAMLSRGGA